MQNVKPDQPSQTAQADRRRAGRPWNDKANKPQGLPRSPSGKKLPRPEPILELVRLFAARMQGRAHSEMSAISPFEDTGMGISRAALSVAAAQLDLGIQYENRELSALVEADFPCILTLVDGMAYLVTGRQNDLVLTVETSQGPGTLPMASFSARYSGLALALSPLEQVETDTRQSERKKSVPRFGKSELVSKILDHVLFHNRKQLMQLALAATLSNLLLVVLPLFIMSVYDRVIPHLAMETLWALAIGVLVALAIDLGLRASRSTLLDAISVSASNHFQGQLYNRLMRLEMRSMPRAAGGLSSALLEFDNLCRIVPQILIAISIDVPFFLLLLGLLYYMGGAVVIAPLIGVSLIAVANLVTYSKSREAGAASAALSHKRTNQLIETIGAVETVKATTSENRLLSKWEELTDAAAFQAYKARHQTDLASHSAIIMVQITIVLTLIIGVYELQAGGMTIGALAASSLLVGRAMAPIGSLIGLFVRSFHILRTSSAIEQINEATQEQAGDRQKRAASIFNGRICFNQVGFAYEGHPAKILKEISLTIEPGERVGLIGRIGCGKSSLLKLLPRLQEAEAGSLLVDDHDIRQFDPGFLRRKFAMMPQEAVLMNGTLRDNICFGLAQVDETAFEKAVEISGVRDFASVHPEGYGMEVGPRGERLSGGERAGVVLARTLLREPQILLLDEPTAAMDNELEQRIVKKLAGWLEGRTLILATHRAPVLALVDRIIWLHNGQIIADGPRDEILAKLKG